MLPERQRQYYLIDQQNPADMPELQNTAQVAKVAIAPLSRRGGVVIKIADQRIAQKRLSHNAAHHTARQSGATNDQHTLTRHATNPAPAPPLDQQATPDAEQENDHQPGKCKNEARVK